MEINTRNYPFYIHIMIFLFIGLDLLSKYPFEHLFSQTKLRGLERLGIFSFGFFFFFFFFCKKYDFCDFLFALVHTKTLLKAVYSKCKRICFSLEHILSSYSRPIFQKPNNCFDSVASRKHTYIILTPLNPTFTRVLQKVLSLGSDYFSATFHQTYFYYKPSKYSPFTETHFCNLFTQSRKADK